MSGTLRLRGSTSGYSELQAPAVAADQTFVLPTTGGTLIATNSPAAKLILELGSASQPSLTFQGDTDTGLFSEGTNTLNLVTGGSSKVVLGAAAHTIYAGTGATVRAIDIDSSGNVGVGTSSPDTVFDIEGVPAATSGGILRIRDTQTTSSAGKGGIHISSSPGIDYYIAKDYNPSNSPTVGLAFGNAGSGAEFMRIDSSGRLLVGTTSAIGTSSDNSYYALLTVKGAGTLPSAQGQMALVRGEGSAAITADEKIGRIVFADSDAGNYALIDCTADGTAGSGDYPGRLVFSTTSDGASSPTERMRIDSNGKLVVTDIGSTAFLSAANSYAQAMISSNVGGLIINSTDTTASSYCRLIFTPNGNVVGNEGLIRYNTNDFHMSFWTQGNERMRLNSSGELLVGTTTSNGLTIGLAPTSAQQNGILYTSSSPFTDTDIYGCGLSGAWKGRIKFYTSNNGAASLAGFVDEEGNLLLGRSGFSLTAYGQTSGDGQWVYRRSSGTPNFNQGSVIQSNNADGGWSMMYMNKFAWNTGDDVRYIDMYKNGATHARLQLTANGANVELTNQSDYRLKENIETYTGGLEAIKALRVCQFDWISNPSYPYKTVGFIAHEVDEVLDDIVTGVKDGTRIDEGGNEVAEYQSLDQSRLVPYLTSALQEAIAKIETLEQRLSDAGIA